MPEAEPAQGDVLAVVPCFNVGRACIPIVTGLQQHMCDILAVDDGSTDDTPTHLESTGAEVLSLSSNRGKGAALLLSFQRAVALGYRGVLTLDGDGQHHPDDVPSLLSAFHEDAHVVLGTRQIAPGSAPLRNWVGNALASWAFARVSHTRLDDCQSGFRIYSTRFLREVLPRLRPGRYETEMQLLLYAVKNGFRISRVPIQTIYDEQSRRLSHFDPLRDTLRVAASMARGFGGYRLAPAGWPAGRATPSC